MSKTKPHTGQYYLDIKFGTSVDSSENSTRLFGYINPIDSLYIIQDINRFLPTFHLVFQDINGYYSSLKPYDKQQSKIQIAFNRNELSEGATIFDFDIYRRFPSSDSVYDVEGALQIKDFSKPSKTRGFSGSVKTTLSTIANEMGINEFEISPSLDISKNVVQPYCSNSELLDYLKNNLIGKQQEAPYFCYITCKKTNQGMKKVFVFRSLGEFYKERVKYTFTDAPVATYNEKAKEVYYPILDFKAFDNYKLLETSGCQQTSYGYFDYDNDEYVSDSLDLTDYFSLTEYFSIDQDGSMDSINMIDTGRNNNFTSDFKGVNKGMFFRKINDLSKIWITSFGLEDIYPGDIVRLPFFENLLNIVSHQYHGFWMVERVVHMLGKSFGTRLLLTRNGVNTVEDTMLKVAENRKRK